VSLQGSPIATVVPERVRAWPFYVAATGTVLALASFAAAMLVQGRLRTARERTEKLVEVAAGPTVIVAPVAVAPEADTLSLACDVKPYRGVRLFPKIDGFLRELHAERGQSVRANQILGVIEAPDAEQTLRSAKVALGLRQRALRRSRALGESGLTSAQDVDRAQVDAEMAATEVARLEALHAYQFLRAPFDGVVVSRSADPGALLVVPPANDAARAVVEVWDTSRVRIQAYVGQAEADRVHDGDAVRIWSDAHPANVKEAAITRTTHALDPATRTMLVEVELDNRDGEFIAGSYAHLKLALKAPRGVAVPVEALTFRGGEPTVAVVQGGRAAFRGIQIGRTDGRNVRVVSGVTEGEFVALFPGDEVTEGAPLRAVFADGRPVAAAMAPSTPAHAAR
jgi:membrane fusion protein (multidrug efflux system)